MKKYDYPYQVDQVFYPGNDILPRCHTCKLVSTHRSIDVIHPRVLKDSTGDACEELLTNGKSSKAYGAACGSILRRIIPTYTAFKNTFEVKLVNGNNATFYGCILNNIPFLFLLVKCNNFKTRIRSFVQKFKPSRYVILFSDNWSMYKRSNNNIGNDKAASAEK